jgi:transitional endoplasmic reticulum ATPase
VIAVKLIIEDDSGLEGTGKVIACIQNPDDFPLGNIESKTIFLQIQTRTHKCGAVLKKIEKSRELLLRVDKYLRILLQASSHSSVEVEPFAPPAATNIKVSIPASWKGSKDEQVIRSILEGIPVTIGQTFQLISLFGGNVKETRIKDTNPDGIVLITSSTKISLEIEKETAGPGGITFANIGGLKRELERIRELVELPLRFPEEFERMGIEPPRGVILFGPPGTGKTLIAKALSNEVGAKFVPISGPEIMSSLFAGSETALRAKFDFAKANTPAVILIDELDSIAPSRDKTPGETEHRVVAMLLTEMDGLTALKNVVVIGTTNRLEAIDIALRRAGRFEPLHIGPPDRNGRVEIMQIHLKKMKQAGTLASDVDIENLAEKTPGFVGADIALLVREAVYCALRRTIPVYKIEKEGVDVEMMAKIKVRQEDFLSALTMISPSAMREVMVQMPLEITWEQIGGLDDIKRTLIESVVYGIKKPEAFKPLGIKPPKGILLYGPPGTGKTMMAKAVARDCGGHFIPVRGPEIRSKWFGESEEKVRFIFAKAREVAPCVIFFDEIDALVPVRGREASGLTDSIVNQILTEFDNLKEADGVFVLGATNLPDILDPAILRPGRFDRQIYVPLPDEKQRESIFHIYLCDNTKLDPNVNILELARITEGFSGADISEVCYLAGRYALRAVDFDSDKALVTEQFYQQAVADVKQTQKRLKPRIGFRTSQGDDGR